MTSISAGSSAPLTLLASLDTSSGTSNTSSSALSDKSEARAEATAAAKAAAKVAADHEAAVKAATLQSYQETTRNDRQAAETSNARLQATEGSAGSLDISV